MSDVPVFCSGCWSHKGAHIKNLLSYLECVYFPKCVLDSKKFQLEMNWDMKIMVTSKWKQKHKTQGKPGQQCWRLTGWRGQMTGPVGGGTKHSWVPAHFTACALLLLWRAGQGPGWWHALHWKPRVMCSVTISCHFTVLMDIRWPCWNVHYVY